MTAARPANPLNPVQPSGQPRNWKPSLLLALLLMGLYSLHGPILLSSGDTLATTLLPYALIRGDGPVLDRFQASLQTPDGHLDHFVRWSRGHVVSRYPLGPALLVVPFYLPQMGLLDATQPGWDRKPADAVRCCAQMGRHSAALLATLLGVVLLYVLEQLGLGRWAFPTALAAGLASNVWAVASQALWQHGPAALALVSAMAFLASPSLSRLRLCLAGLACAALVCFRAIDLVLAAAILLYVARQHTWNLIWFLPFPVLLGGALVGYNLWFFGSLAGGLGELEALHPELHGVAGTWSGSFLEGAAGTLLSPSRGLFLYSPWTALALLTVPATAPALGRQPLVRFLLLALVPYFLVLSCYAVWWGGHGFGPRYWIDVMPLFAILLGFGLRWSYAQCRLLFAGFVAALLFSTAVQVLGVFCYTGSWDQTPADVDVHHERLWDWSDSPLSRCLHEVRR